LYEYLLKLAIVKKDIKLPTKENIEEKILIMNENNLLSVK